LGAAGDVVAHRGAARPLHDARAEALVGEAPRWVEEGVTRGLEVDEVAVDVVRVEGRGRFVRVVQRREPAEAALDVALRGAGRDA
jgi:hypothetical protein